MNGFESNGPLTRSPPSGRRPLPSRLRLAAVGLCALALAGGAAFSQPGTDQARADMDRSAAGRGQAIAVGGGPAGAGAACISCHGVDGQGDAAAGFPRIAGLHPRYLFKQMADYASGARPNPVMSPIAQQLDERDWQGVASYYAALQPLSPARAQVTPAAAPAELQYGGAIYAVGSAELGIQGCANCHGPAGIGMDPVYPRLAGQHASYAAGQLRLWREGVRKNDPAGVMGAIARRMGDREIDAVAAYLASLGR